MPEEKLFYLGVKGLIRNDQGQILLLKIHTDERTYFDLPGGRINNNEPIEKALAREVYEETGIEIVSILHFLGMALTSMQIPITADTRGGLILVIYTCEAAIPDSFQTEPNMQAVWCNKEDVAPKLTDYPEELKGTIARHLH